jgi:hypothetical protein
MATDQLLRLPHRNGFFLVRPDAVTLIHADRSYCPKAKDIIPDGCLVYAGDTYHRTSLGIEEVEALINKALANGN